MFKIFVSCGLLGASSYLLADNENITYDNSSGGLQHLYGGSVFLPGTVATPSTSNNTVTVDYTSNVDPSLVLGGYSITTDVSGNTVYMLNGNIQGTGWGNIYGGMSTIGTATDNHVYMNGGSVDRYVVGGRGMTDASYNSVTMNSGTVGALVGGEAMSQNAHHNTVTLNDGTINNNVGGLAMAAGWSNYGSSAYNTININGGTVSGDIYGAYTSNSAYNNTINIRNNPDLQNASIYGHSNATGMTSNNALNIYTSGVQIQAAGNFTDYNFYLPDTIKAGDSVLTGTGTINVTGANIVVKSFTAGTVFSAGDRITLIDATSLGGGAATLVNNGVTSQGIGLIYDYSLEQIGDTSISLKINKMTLNPKIKALSEGYLAGSMLTTRGADLVAYEAIDAINLQNKGGLSPFIMTSTQRNRYNSGSHITSNDVLLSGGLSYKEDHITAAALIEGGWGDYDSYNSFNTGKVHGKGNNRYYGVGLLGRYDFTNGFYTDASLRYGKTHIKFNTKDIWNSGTGQYADYKLKPRYVSAHIGLGYIAPLNDKNSLDISGKYLWTRMQGKDAFIAGNNFSFEHVNSNRVRIDSTVNHQYSPTVSLRVGLGYEREFDGKARGKVEGFYFDSPNVKGGTVIASVGANMKPSENSPFSFDIKTQGYGGKREGVGLNVKMNYAF